jgi:hypothetical protein
VGCVPLFAPSRHTWEMKPLSSGWHLVARFFTSLSSAPPSQENLLWVEERLTPAELALWKRQSDQDQRHSAYVARRFAELREGATDAEVAGAILHDVGKVECGLGTFGRVAGTIVGPHGSRFSAYHDHEMLGAEMAAAAGSDPSTVELIAGEGPAFEDLKSCDHA